MINVIKKILIAICIVTVLISFSACQKPTNTTTTTTSSQNSGTDNSSVSGLYTPSKLDETKTYYAEITVKDYGKIIIKLDQKSAPISVANFVELANKGFYNGLTFHRIMNNFMMQGGDPEGNGYGGPGYSIYGEFSSNGFDNQLKHTRGAISMARSFDPNSAGSQFFIVHQDSPFLDGSYAVFGYVTEGLDVVDEICNAAKPTDNNGSIAKADQPKIETVVIRAE